MVCWEQCSGIVASRSNKTGIKPLDVSVGQANPFRCLHKRNLKVKKNTLIWCTKAHVALSLSHTTSQLKKPNSEL